MCRCRNMMPALRRTLRQTSAIRRWMTTVSDESTLGNEPTQANEPVTANETVEASALSAGSETSLNEQDLKHTIEATLLAAGRPVTTQQLLDLFDERERPAPEHLQAALDLLSADYETRGIELTQVASGWRIQVKPRCVDVVSRLWQERPSRYSR